MIDLAFHGELTHVYISRKRTLLRLLMPVGWLLLLGGIGAMFAHALGLVPLLLGALLLLVVSHRMRRKFWTVGEAQRDGERIVFRLGPEDGDAVALQEIAGAWSIGNQVNIRLLSGAQLDFEAESEAAAEACIDRLGLGATKRVFEVTMPNGRTLTIGADGLRIDGVFRQRYLSYEHIHRASWDPHGVLLELDDDSKLLLPTRRRVAIVGAAETEDEMETRAAVWGRLQAVLQQRDPQHAALAALPLDRAGRDAASWLEALRELRKPQYRKLAIDDALLADVLEDPAQPPDRRIGAAVLIVVEGASRDRVLAAADACADPAAARALRRAADGQIDTTALDEAMQRFGETATKVRRPASRDGVRP